MGEGSVPAVRRVGADTARSIVVQVAAVAGTASGTASGQVTLVHLAMTHRHHSAFLAVSHVAVGSVTVIGQTVETGHSASSLL